MSEVIYEFMDRDVDSVRVFSDGTMTMYSGRYGYYCAPFRLSEVRLGDYIAGAPSGIFWVGVAGEYNGEFENAAEWLEHVQSLLLPSPREGHPYDPVTGGDLSYFERKADRGKPRMSLIPHEAYQLVNHLGRDYPHGAPLELHMALVAFQSGDAAGEEQEMRSYVMSILSYLSLEPVARVLAFGAEKYAENSWREVPDAIARYRDAMWRHQVALDSGEKTDPESGLPHTAHRDCCAVFLYALLQRELNL